MTRGTWQLRLYAGLLCGLLLVNAAGFTVTETLRRLGPVPLGHGIAYSTLVVDRGGVNGCAHFVVEGPV